MYMGEWIVCVVRCVCVFVEHTIHHDDSLTVPVFTLPSPSLALPSRSPPPPPPQTRTMKQLVPFSLAGNIFILAGIGVLVFFTMEHAIEDGVAADMPIVRRGWERGRESEERQREAERVERDQSERARRHMHVQL